MPELIWDGKHDDAGRKVAPPRIVLPFQTVETVNESAQERQRTLDFFASERLAEWRNRLIWGDKKYVLPSLLAEFSEAVDLIYIDPPFATGADFSLPIKLDTSSFTKEPSVIEQKAYRDTWGVSNDDRRRGVTPYDRYIRWIYDTVTVLRDLLTEHGSIYVHVGPHVSHLVRMCLDDVFGVGSFRAEIIWKRTGAHGAAKRYAPVHDVILYYSKSDTPVWNPSFHNYSDEYLTDKYRYSDERGQYRLITLFPDGIRRGATGESWRGIDPTAKGLHWRYPPTRLEELDAAGMIYWGAKGEGLPQLKRYLDEAEGVSLQDIWTDIAPLNSQALERFGYPTQKPVALLERIIQASSSTGDLVLDCVCGSGTTSVAAEKLGRRWIACDLGRFAVHTARKRLLSMADVRPFVVQNLGKYERQAWQTAEFGESADTRTSKYRSFILDLYHATPVAGYSWLHGLKQGRMVHAGTVDAPVTVGDVKQIVAEFRKAIGTGEDAPTKQSVDILGWDFAFELNEIARQDAERAGIELRLVRIPREVLDKRAVEQGDIRFFELAALDVKVTQSARTIKLNVEDFVIPLDDVPADIQKAVTHWSQWIDYWAVDWDNKDDTFHNEWQTYRTRDSKDLALKAAHEYEAPGDYRVVVKVIDILGNDTTKTLQVKVGK
jgi:adenine-specific DNA-methyltransferase